MQYTTISRRALLAGMAAAGAATLALRPAFAQTKTLRLSHHLAPGHQVDVASHKFAELVAEYTGGALKIEVFPSAQIAGLRQAAEAVQLGTVDIVWTDLGTLGNWQPQYGFISLPFLFADTDHFNKFIASDGGKELTESIRTDFMIEALGYGNAGFRVIATRDRAVNGPDDMKGLRIRVPEVPVFVSSFQAVGANPTPMAWGEVYTAMQTGVIDAVENPSEGLVQGTIYEVAKHISKTNHIMTDINLFINDMLMQGLPADQQDAIRRAAAEAISAFNTNTAAASDTNWAKLAESATAVENPDRAAFQTAMKPVWDDFVAANGEAAQAWIDKVAAAA